jgi:CSLREA domain-containing protein
MKKKNMKRLFCQSKLYTAMPILLTAAFALCIISGAQTASTADGELPGSIVKNEVIAVNATLAATFTVTKTADTNDAACNSDCSLREAIAAAATGDTIVFDETAFAGTQIIELTIGELVVGKNLNIEGTSAARLTVRRSSAAATNFRIFNISSARVLTLGKMTISGGVSASNGGGILINSGGILNLSNAVIRGNSTSNDGGGIHNNFGTVNITDSSLLLNSAASCGGGLSSAQAAGQTVISNSLIKDNTAGGCGGGVNLTGGASFSITNSTIDSNIVNVSTNGGAGIAINSVSGIVGNSAITRNQCQSGQCNGGGINNNNGGNLTVFNSTFASNTAVFGGGIMSFGSLLLVNSTLAFNSTNSGNGGGLYRAGGSSIRLRNTLIANNTSSTSPDVGGAVTSLGNNLIGNTTGSSGFSAASNDILNPAGGAGLSALANNGGTTETAALSITSPAINTGNNCVRDQSCPTENLSVFLTTDQRLFIHSGVIDIGAFELNGTPTVGTLTVTKTADTNDGACDQDCSLREAIAAAQPGNTILFSALFDDPQIITLSGAAGFGQLVINKSLTIMGKGAQSLTVRRSPTATAEFRIFEIGGDITVNLSGITIAGGNVSGEQGGGIRLTGSSRVAVTNSHITGNNAQFGGGIFNSYDSTLTLTGSTVSANTADCACGGGAGINNDGALTITNSTLSGNVKTNGAGNSAGGIFNFATGTITITSSTIADNQAADPESAGGIFRNGGTITVRNSTIAQNRNNAIVPDVAGGAFVSEGYNLIGNTGTVTGFSQTGDQTGNSATPVNPGLDALGLYGGTTPTHRLQTSSPAIDKGKSFGLTSDQRGEARPIDTLSITNEADGADIGAFEAPPNNFTAFVVTKTADTNDGACNTDCSLREAITAANADGGAETITFSIPTSDSGYDSAAGRYTIALGALGALPDLSSLTIRGTGANVLTVKRGAAATQFRIFKVPSGAIVTISGLTISGGDADFGGGIQNDGTLTLTASAVSGNTVSSIGAGIFSNFDSTLTIADSTVSGNSTDNGNGGGIAAVGTITITNSTISSNSAGFGGGILTFTSSATLLTITSSTISNNSAQNYGGGIAHQNSTPAILRNTIVANNTAGTTSPDLRGTITSQGFNLVGNNSGATITPATGDQIGTFAAPLDPLLGPLQNNGGFTETRALLAGSPAIDKGDDNSTSPTADQRGFARPVDLNDATYPNTSDATDIGAFEAQTAPSGGGGFSFVVSKVADTNDGACNTDCSLREAITAANANAGPDLITFDLAGAGPHLIQLTGALPNLSQSVGILNTSGESVTVRRDTGGDYRIFTINEGQNVQISGLIITNGNDVSSDGGGAINNGNYANLTVSNSSISRNTTSGFGGGGIYNGVGSILRVTNTTVNGNIAVGNGNGGGIAGVGTITITNSTVSDNSARFGGGIMTFQGTALTITSSTVSNNSSQNYGGGILDQSGAIIRNTIVANNTAVTNRPDISGTFNSEGYNLIEDASGATINETQNAGTNIIGQDPNLGALQNNGGTTETHALLTSSPAIDKGKSFGLTSDQRGFIRPFDASTIANAADGSDIGAFEVQAATFGISGIVSYGTTPTGQTTKYVSDVALIASGASDASVNTNSSGFYLLNNLTANGQYTVTPSKTGNVNGITPFDATLVLRCVAAGTNCALTDNQKLAADTNNSNTITPFDATQILRYVAANQQTANTGAVGNWKFNPPNRIYNPLMNSSSNQDYAAILIGEVNGSWTPPTGSFAAGENSADSEDGDGISTGDEFDLKTTITAFESIESELNAAAQTETDVQIALPIKAAIRGTTISIPVFLNNSASKAVSGYGFAVRFNPNVLQPIVEAPFDVSETLSQNNFTIVADTKTPGIISIAGSSGSNAIFGTSGTLLNLNFAVIGTPKSAISMTFEKASSGKTIVEDAAGNRISVRALSGSLFIGNGNASKSTIALTGRIQTADGKGLKNAQIILTDSFGEQRTVVSGAFGRYNIADVAIGQTVTVQVFSKRFNFEQQIINLTEETNEINFASAPN